MMSKGLEMMRKMKEEGGIEGALKRGQEIMSDEKQRDEMIEKVKDTILDFLLKYLPSIGGARDQGRGERHQVPRERHRPLGHQAEAPGR